VAPVDPNLPVYRVGAGDTRCGGVVRIIMNRLDGTFVCGGPLLDRADRCDRSWHSGVLSAAHCFSNTAGENIANSVTIEFRSARTGELLGARRPLARTSRSRPATMGRSSTSVTSRSSV
jgi:hypothetical protein